MLPHQNRTGIIKAKNTVTGTGLSRVPAIVLLVLGLVLMILAGCGQLQPADEAQLAPTATPSAVPAGPWPTLPARWQEQTVLPAMVTVDIVGSGDAQSTFQRPAYVAAEVAGRDVSNVSLIGGTMAEDGRRRVLLYRPVDPDPLDDQWPGSWSDGVHELIQTWDFAADFLWDGKNGDFVVLWTTDPQADTRTVHGRFRPAGEDDYHNVILVLNMATGAVERVIETATGEPLQKQAGDEFQLTNLILTEDGVLHTEPGLSLFFDDGAQLAYTSRPAPNGTYFLGVGAEATEGDADFASFEVDNETLAPGYQALFDPYRGFQFLYPETWSETEDRGGHLTVTDPSAAIRLRISTHPEMSSRPAADLKNMALDAYGDVTVLYEDQVAVGQGGGLRTVYGYHSGGGPRTGVMLAFSLDGQSFLIDIDGPAADEAALLELAGVVAGSWTARPVSAAGSGRWTEAVVDGLQVVVPADYRYAQMSNGWHHFAAADDQAFIALRSELAGEGGLFSRMDHWLGVAGRNVDGFSASPVYTMERGGRSWARVDFEYALDSGQPVAGEIMVMREGDRLFVLWTEAPAEFYQRLEEEVFLLVVDEISHSMPSSPGAP